METNKPEAPKMNVLAWFDDYIRRCGAYDDGTPIRAAVAELIEAAKAVADFTPEARREKWRCHYGITTAAECGHCSRELRLAAALANIGSAI